MFHNNMVADMMLMTQNGTSGFNQVYVSDGEKGRLMTSVLANSSQTVGATACATGFASLYRCGVVTGVDTTQFVPRTGGATWTELHMWIASFSSGGGDSGGPVFYGNREMGIVDDVAGGSSYYSTMAWEESASGAVPCLNTSCS